MYILPIASGSSGNSMYVELADVRFLIDVGVSFGRIDASLREENRSFESIDAVFITHTHIDHIKGLVDYPMPFNSIPAFISEESYTNDICGLDLRKIRYNADYRIGSITFKAIPTSHDSRGSVGFVFESEDEKLSYFTDLGYVSERIVAVSLGASCAVIEANHDLEMLANNPYYPDALKNRIRSSKGHLSNEACRNYIEALFKAGTKHFFLAHLSQENNSPEKALSCMDRLSDVTCEIIPLLADGGSPKTIMDHKTTSGQKESGEEVMDSLFSKSNPVDRYIINTKRIPARTAAYSDYPAELLPEIQSYLRQSGIPKLYQHQADMFLQAIAGSNIVITTSTASGKTLSFLLPVLQQILKDPQSRAIFIYPTKALASDQYRALKPFLDYFGKGKIDAGVYDGDTPVNERSRIRNSSNIILTNPEMLNSAFLPHHNQNGFNFVFSNLKFVIIDELHTYRGAFGSHLSNIFRRLNRVCRYYNSSPQFFCSSATIANPVELAETICGKDFVLIEKDGSPAPEKQYTLIQPPYVGSDKAYRKPVSDIAAELVPYLTVTKHSFIAFCKSRKAVEVVLKESRDHLKNEGIPGADYSGLISGYRGGYRPEERKEIERKMVNGQLRGLISTNALELGIDIGKIDTTVIAGYPGTRASFWQQSGRAGRSGVSSNTYFILDNLPFDQFIAVDPEWLFQSTSENAVVDPNNLFIQLAHVRAAAAELPLSLDDIAIFPDLGEIIPVLVRAQELRSMNGKFMWSGKEFPAGDYNLRNMDNARYQLINSVDDSVITEMDEIQAFREIHQGAVYLHDGQAYLVSALDVEKKRAIAAPIKDDYYTEPFVTGAVSIIKEHKKKDIGRCECGFGDVKVSTTVGGHKKIQFHNHQNLGYDQLDPPLSKAYDTEGVWIQLPEEVAKIYKKLEPGVIFTQPRNYWKTYTAGISFAIQNAAMMLTMTTSEDISSGLVPQLEIDSSASAICIYDMFVGGLGYSEKAYDLIDAIIHNAIKMVEGCRCKDGCAACVGDYHLDKRVVLWGLKSMYEKLEPPVDVKSIEEPEIEIEQKPFSFEDIEFRWEEFVCFFHDSGESMSNFITSVKSVKKDNATLVLYVENSFFATWIMEEANRTRLANSISHYVDVPVQFSIRAESSESPTGEKEEKITRRYQDLNK